jgi:NADPH-dependent ferric siderophore reductase
MAMTELASGRAVRPDNAQVGDFTVLATQRISRGFIRLTLCSRSEAFEESFSYLGYDQWFRLFLPNEHGVLEPPYGGQEGWYTRWNAQAEDRRPVIRNYTIRDARQVDGRWQIDVDFVLHASADGHLEGIAAGWANAAQPGAQVGLLDQGPIFNAPESGPIMIIADESGLPGVEGIARSLAGRPATYLLEVPHTDDRRDLVGADPIWQVRSLGTMPGSLALQELQRLDVDLTSYVYIVGEAAFMLAARKDLKDRGIGKEQMDFCAYWRPTS